MSADSQQLANPPAAPAADDTAALLHMLEDCDIFGEKRLVLPTLQTACMRVPQLSAHLLGPLRCKLYSQLLIDSPLPMDRLPESFAEMSQGTTDDNWVLARRLALVFAGASAQPTEQELAGLLEYLYQSRAAIFDDYLAPIALAMATVVREAGLTSSNDVLRVLLAFLESLLVDYLVLGTETQKMTFGGTTGETPMKFGGAASALLRLMLQYQDPALSVHLDHNQADIGVFLLDWTRRLFVLHDDYATALCVLDWIFILGDPIMVPYVALAYIVSNRQKLLHLTSKKEIQAALTSTVFTLPRSKAEAIDPQLVSSCRVSLIPMWSGKTLLQNAELLFRNTPVSTQRVLECCLYPDSGSINKAPEELAAYYAASPCLPLERSDLASSFAVHPPTGEDALPLEYIIADCRSRESFDYAHLPTAMFVGDRIGFDTSQIAELVSQTTASRGQHLSIFGTGRQLEEEANLLKVVALHFIQAGYPFVSLTTGGFKTVIPLIRARMIRVVMSEQATVRNPNVNASGSALAGAVDNLSTLFPEREAVKARADELANKAKEKMTAASAWGWGMVQKVQERFAETQQQHQQFSQGAQGASAQASSSQTPAAGTAGVPLKGRVISDTQSFQPSGQPQQHVFSLGEDDEDDDFGLITSVPPKPLKGTVVSAAAADASQKPASTVSTEASPSPAPTARPKPAEGVGAIASAANIDAEFDALFGDTA